MGDLALMGLHDSDDVVSAESTEIDRRQNGAEEGSGRRIIEVVGKAVLVTRRLFFDGGAGQGVEVIVTLPRKELD
jgi:hypothetical protein